MNFAKQLMLLVLVDSDLIGLQNNDFDYEQLIYLIGDY